MANIIRSVFNTRTYDIAMTHRNIVLPHGLTTDLFTLISDDELLQIQPELNALVASGSDYCGTIG